MTCNVQPVCVANVQPTSAAEVQPTSAARFRCGCATGSEAGCVVDERARSDVHSRYKDQSPLCVGYRFRTPSSRSNCGHMPRPEQSPICFPSQAGVVEHSTQQRNTTVQRSLIVLCRRIREKRSSQLTEQQCPRKQREQVRAYPAGPERSRGELGDRTTQRKTENQTGAESLILSPGHLVVQIIPLLSG